MTSFRKYVLLDITNKLNQALNTHVLDDKYLEIVCAVYKCPFRLQFKPLEQKPDLLEPIQDENRVTTHSQSAHEKRNDPASDEEIDLKISFNSL